MLLFGGGYSQLSPSNFPQSHPCAAWCSSQQDPLPAECCVTAFLEQLAVSSLPQSNPAQLVGWLAAGGSSVTHVELLHVASLGAVQQEEAKAGSATLMWMPCVLFADPCMAARCFGRGLPPHLLLLL